MTTTELERAEQAIETLTPVVMDVIQKAKALSTIVDHNSFMEADGFLAELKRVQKRLDDERKRFTQPLDLAKRQIMDAYKPKATLLVEAEQILKGATRKWYIAEQERKRKEEERLREEERKRQEEKKLDEAVELEKHGNATQAEAVLNTPVVTSTPKVKTSFDQGSSYGRKTWKVEITDTHSFLKAVVEGKVNPDYIDINISMLRRIANAKKGEVSWPGIRITEDVVMGVRR